MSTPVRALVSVVMPARNAAPFIGLAIDSALAQTWAPVEVIVADDGSTDDTIAVARAHGDDRVIVVSGGPSSAGAARNRAIGAASGEYLAFLDADDMWYPAKLSTQLATFDERPGLVGVGAVFRFRMRDRVAGMRGEILTPEKLALVRDAKLMPLTFSSLVVPRWVLDRVGLFDESLRYGEDLDLLARIAAAGDVVVLGDVLGEYRVHPAGLSRTNQLENQRWIRFVEERTAARATGAELTWSEFVSRPAPIMRRDELRRAAARSYQDAGNWFVSGRYARAVVALLVALIRDPGYTVAKLRRQRLWRR